MYFIWIYCKYQKHKSSGLGFLFLFKVRIIHESSVSVLETTYLHFTEYSSFFPTLFSTANLHAQLAGWRNLTKLYRLSIRHASLLKVSRCLQAFSCITSKCVTNVRKIFHYWFYLFFFPFFFFQKTAAKMSTKATAGHTSLHWVQQTSLWPPKSWIRARSCSVKPLRAWWVMFFFFFTCICLMVINAWVTLWH